MTTKLEITAPELRRPISWDRLFALEAPAYRLYMRLLNLRATNHYEDW